MKLKEYIGKSDKQEIIIEKFKKKLKKINIKEILINILLLTTIILITKIILM